MHKQNKLTNFSVDLFTPGTHSYNFFAATGNVIMLLCAIGVLIQVFYHLFY